MEYIILRFINYLLRFESGHPFHKYPFFVTRLKKNSSKNFTFFSNIYNVAQV
jgi:hypothetical protein